MNSMVVVVADVVDVGAGAVVVVVDVLGLIDVVVGGTVDVVDTITTVVTGAAVVAGGRGASVEGAGLCDEFEGTVLTVVPPQPTSVIAPSAAVTIKPLDVRIRLRVPRTTGCIGPMLLENAS
tara:strand:+ start:124 stop:489 length:366 start_codon:yes stop_codon:yes gene_type:complete